MADDRSGIHGGGFEEVVSELRREFLDELGDRLRDLALLAEAARRGERPVKDLAREARKLALAAQGQVSAMGFPLIESVAKRMEDFLTNVRDYPPRAVADIARYAETLQDIAEGKVAPDTEPRALVRRLPPKLGFDLGDIEVRDVEVMLVMLHGAATRFVERELQQCGYRTTTVTSTFEALPQIVLTRPDLVVVSAVMPDLSGIDLAIAIAHMPATRNIPVALITSLDPDDEYLRLLPKHVPVILKGPSFGDDLAAALDRLFLI